MMAKNNRLGEYNTALLPHVTSHLSAERWYDTVILLNFMEHFMDTFCVHNIMF